MALRVWLPLNGDLHNQGLSDVTVTVTGTTSFTDGKIGRGLSANGSTYWLISPITIGNTCSIAWWMKSTDTNAMPFVMNANVYSSLNFWIYNNKYFLNTGDSLNNPFQNNGADVPSINDGLWHHFVVTFDGTACLLYIDGNYYGKSKTYKSPATPTNSNIRLAGGFYLNQHQYDTAGIFNDFRVYDHVLSPKEIKEISKGLVLHYKLDDPYAEPTTNLATYSTNYSNKTYGVSFALSGWGGDAGTCTVYGSGGYNNGPYKVYHKTSTGSGGCYWKAANDIHIQAGKTYTFSVYVKSSRNYTDSTYSFNINRGSDNKYIAMSSAISFTTEWQRISKTFTATDSDAGDYGEMSIIYNDTETDYYVYYSCFQIEEKDHATPYVNGTRTQTTVDDVSGYKHNGTINGNIAIAMDTPKYVKSYNFTDSACAIGIGNLATIVPEGLFTFNIWFKKTTGNWSSKAWETILGGPSGFELEGKLSGTQNAYVHPYSWGGGSTTTPNSYSIQYELDKWNMLTMVRNASDTKFYLNGELKVTGSKGSIPSGDYFIGAWKTAVQQNYRGLLSDARIYATALSAEDIDDLYHTSAFVDDGQNIETFEFYEVTSDSPNITKSGIFRAQTFTEDTSAEIYTAEVKANQLIEI